MTICDSCDHQVATSQVTFIAESGEQVFFVCEGCVPTGDVVHRVSFIFEDMLGVELEAMFV